jgi:hypothetical protein
MASLRSILEDGRFYLECQEPGYIDSMQELMAVITYRLVHPETILVNAQGVWDDLVPAGGASQEHFERAMQFHSIPRPKPSFHTMWLETLLEGLHSHQQQRLGALISRREIGVDGNLDQILTTPSGQKLEEFNVREAIEQDGPSTLVHASVWHDFEGSAVCNGQLLYWLDESGNFQRSVRWVYRPTQFSDQEYQYRRALAHLHESWILNTFARLNCANVSLKPRANQKTHHHHERRRNGRAQTIWHEIIVDSIPHTRPVPAAPSGEVREIRLHWVRGHYADYTKGKGLFGNAKLRAVFWIPEHRAGSAEAGEVKATYSVKGN